MSKLVSRKEATIHLKSNGLSSFHIWVRNSSKQTNKWRFGFLFLCEAIQLLILQGFWLRFVIWVGPGFQKWAFPWARRKSSCFFSNFFPSEQVTRKYNVPALKFAMDLLGYYGGPSRSPLTSLTNIEAEDVRDCFRNYLRWFTQLFVIGVFLRNTHRSSKKENALLGSIEKWIKDFEGF